MKFYAGDDKQSMIDRGLTFQMVMDAPVIDFVDNPDPARPEQKILIVEIDGYAVAAPCKPLENDEWLIVTAFRSTKYTKKYLKRNESEK